MFYYRVTTFLENLEKSGNFVKSGKVRENRQSKGKVREIMIVPCSQHPSQIQILPPKALRMHIFA